MSRIAGLGMDLADMERVRQARDEEVIAAADAAGIAMVFTGHRHFLH